MRRQSVQLVTFPVRGFLGGVAGDVPLQPAKKDMPERPEWRETRKEERKDKKE